MLHRGYWIAVAGLLAAAGCTGDVAEQVQQSAAQVKQQVATQVDNATTVAKEQLQLSGKSEITLDQPLSSPGCYAHFVAPAEGRPGVLILQSYRLPEQEQFPSFYLHAQVDKPALAELVGQTLAAQMFVKPTAAAASWHTTAGQSVQLRIDAADARSVVAEVVGGTLARTDGSATQTAAGKFTAVLP